MRRYPSPGLLLLLIFGSAIPAPAETPSPRDLSLSNQLHLSARSLELRARPGSQTGAAAAFRQFQQVASPPSSPTQRLIEQIVDHAKRFAPDGGASLMPALSAALQRHAAEAEPLSIQGRLQREAIDQIYKSLGAGPGCCPCLSSAGCGDMLFCNGAEECSNSICAAGPDPCVDGDVCTSDDCDEGRDNCIYIETPAPGLIAGLTADRPAIDLAELAWYPESGSGHAIVYDVVTGALAVLRESSGPSDATCVADGLTSPMATAVQASPAAGDGYWYLARARDVCADGSFDGGFASQVAPRDQSIAASAGTCDPCEHSKCEPGSALDVACGPCAASVCEFDSFCCTSSWDELCVEEVRTVCGSLTCPESQGSCDHTLCETGGALVSGCDSGQAGCVATVCAEDAFCCDTEWDQVCVDEVATLCQLNCL